MEEPRDFKNILKEDNLSKMLEDLNIEEPENNMFTENASTHDLMHLQLEMNNKALNEALKILLPEEGDKVDGEKQLGNQDAPTTPSRAGQ